MMNIHNSHSLFGKKTPIFILVARKVEHGEKTVEVNGQTYTSPEVIYCTMVNKKLHGCVLLN